MADVFADPHVLAREMLVELPHATIGSVKLPGVPMKFSETPAVARTAPPVLGQDTRAVLRELCSLSDAEIADLEFATVIQSWTPRS
jgi:formyl-CoA transferase